jgi:hypothetical protein
VLLDGGVRVGRGKSKERESGQAEEEKGCAGESRAQGGGAAGPCGGGAEFGCSAKVFQRQSVGKDERGGGFSGQRARRRRALGFAVGERPGQRLTHWASGHDGARRSADVFAAAC